MDRGTVLLLGLKSDTLDSLGELAQVCRVGELIASLAVDVTDVGVHSDAFHVVLFGTQIQYRIRDRFQPIVDGLETVTSIQLNNSVIFS